MKAPGNKKSIKIFPALGLTLTFFKNYYKKNFKIINFIVVAFLAWQITINAAAMFSSIVLPARRNYMYVDGVGFSNPKFLWTRANFDGSHYLMISRYGYGVYKQAFFPFYPELIRFLRPLFFGKDLLAALFISNLSFLISLYLLYKLILLDFDDKVAQRTIVFLLLFPTSFFFGMVYTESLFFLLLIGCAYAARKDRWLWAGILGALASYTRLVGIFICPALCLGLFLQNKFKEWQKNLVSFLAVVVSLFGLFKYMLFLNGKYGDPLMFFRVQSYFGQGRTGSKIILLYQVFWRYLRMMVTIITTKWDPAYYATLLEFLTGLGFLLLLALAYQKKIRPSYLFFAFLAFLTPTLTGVFVSLPRYCLVLFPCFIYLGTIENKKLLKGLTVFFYLLLVLTCSLFLQGYWIA